MKFTIKRVMAAPLLFKSLRRHLLKNPDACTVLSFHRILPKGHPDYRYTEPELVIDKDRFVELAGLLADSTEVLDAKGFMEWLSGSYRTARTASLITFDDGWKDTLEFASEPLKSLGLPAVVFVCPKVIEEDRYTLWFEEVYRLLLKATESNRAPSFAEHGKTPEESAKRTLERLKRTSAAERDEAARELRSLFANTDETPRLLDWNDLSGLMDIGIEPQCHTLSHEILTMLTDSEIRSNLEKSKRLINERLGFEPRLLAYPNGEADARTASIARDCGFAAAFTTDDSRIERGKADAMLLPRRAMSEVTAPSKSVFVWKLAGLP